MPPSAAQIELWNFFVRCAEKWVGSPARPLNEKKQIPARLQQPAVVLHIMGIPKKEVGA